jgi:hypothetical protein
VAILLTSMDETRHCFKESYGSEELKLYLLVRIFQKWLMIRSSIAKPTKMKQVDIYARKNIVS